MRALHPFGLLGLVGILPQRGAQRASAGTTPRASTSMGTIRVTCRSRVMASSPWTQGFLARDRSPSSEGSAPRDQAAQRRMPLCRAHAGAMVPVALRVACPGLETMGVSDSAQGHEAHRAVSLVEGSREIRRHCCGGLPVLEHGCPGTCRQRRPRGSCAGTPAKRRVPAGCLPPGDASPRHSAAARALCHAAQHTRGSQRRSRDAVPRRLRLRPAHPIVPSGVTDIARVYGGASPIARM